MFDLSVNSTLALESISVGSEETRISAVAFSPLASGTKWLAVTSGDAVLLMRVGARLVRCRLDQDHGKRYLQSLARGA